MSELSKKNPEYSVLEAFAIDVYNIGLLPICIPR